MATAPRERTVEQYLRRRCGELGLLCLKFTSPGRSGVPDRVLLGRDANGDAITLFIEVKRPGERPRPSQVATIDEMRGHGAHVVVADSVGAVDALLADYVTAPSVAIADRDPRDAPLPGRQSSPVLMPADPFSLSCSTDGRT